MPTISICMIVKNEEKQGITRAYDKLLEENKILKSADNNDTFAKNEKTEESN